VSLSTVDRVLSRSATRLTSLLVYLPLLCVSTLCSCHKHPLPPQPVSLVTVDRSRHTSVEHAEPTSPSQAQPANSSQIPPAGPSSTINVSTCPSPPASSATAYPGDPRPSHQPIHITPLLPKKCPPCSCRDAAPPCPCTAPTTCCVCPTTQRDFSKSCDEKKATTQLHITLDQADDAMRVGRFDVAVKLYAKARESGAEDAVIEQAKKGYEQARSKTQEPWWVYGTYFPPVRWYHTDPKPPEFRLLLWLLALFLLLVLSPRFPDGRGILSRLGDILKKIFMPSFRGRAHIIDPVKLTKDAEADLFAQALRRAAAEEVLDLLDRNLSGLKAQAVTMLTIPSVLAGTAIQACPTSRASISARSSRCCSQSSVTLAGGWNRSLLSGPPSKPKMGIPLSRPISTPPRACAGRGS